MDNPGNLADRLAARRAPADDETDAIDDCGAYGYLRGVRDRGLMIDYRFLNGNREALPYALLERIGYDPSVGITLKYLSGTVLLVGRHLATPQANGFSLLDALHRHRVPWIREAEELRVSLWKGTDAVITAIKWKPGA